MCVKHGAVVARAWTSPNLLAKRACSPSSAKHAAQSFFGRRARRTHRTAGAAGWSRWTRQTRASLSSPAVSMNRPVGSKRMARMTSECHARGSAVGSAAGAGAEASAPAGGSAAEAMAASASRSDASATRRSSARWYTRTVAPKATATSAPEGCAAISGDAAWRISSLPQLSPGPPLPGRAPPPSPPLPLFLRRLRPIAMTERLRASRTRRVGARASSAPDDVRLARVDVTGGRRTARGRAEARARQRGETEGADPRCRACFVVSTHLTFSATNVPEGVVATNVSDPEKNAPGIRMSI